MLIYLMITHINSFFVLYTTGPDCPFLRSTLALWLQNINFASFLEWLISVYDYHFIFVSVLKDMTSKLTKHWLQSMDCLTQIPFTRWLKIYCWSFFLLKRNDLMVQYNKNIWLWRSHNLVCSINCFDVRYVSHEKFFLDMHVHV